MGNKTTSSLLKKQGLNWQLLLSVGYGIAVAIGMLFTFTKYAAFSINIFDYAGIYDFLIAPFADSMILLFIVGTILTCVIWYVIDFYWRKWFPQGYSKSLFNLDKKPFFNKSRPYILGVSFVIYLWFAAHLYGAKAFDVVISSDPITLTFTDQHQRVGKLIGKTTSFIFLYTPEQSVIAIPIGNSLKELDLGGKL